MKRRFHIFSGVLLTVTFSSAQTVSCPERIVIANVITKDGRPIENLGVANFRAKTGGKFVEVNAVSFEKGPHRVVILFDVSGSMADSSRYNSSRLVLEEFAAAAPTSIALALVEFSFQVQATVDFTKKRKAVFDKIAELKSTPRNEVRGNTAILTAIREAVSILTPPQLGDSIYLISDGEDNDSSIKEVSIQRLLSSAGIRLFAFVPPPTRPQPSWAPKRYEWVTDTAKATGGTSTILFPFLFGAALSDQDRSTLQSTTRAQIQRIAEFYRVQVRPRETTSQWRHWSLTTLDAAGTRLRDAEVQFPAELAPCR